MRNQLLPLAFIALTALAGCGGGEAGNSSAPDIKSGKITIALNWFPEAEHGGFYAALVHGYYEAEGLDIEIRPGGPGTKVVAEVATGKATFGVANADKILTGCAQDADVVALMAPIQDSPRCIMVHEESGVESLEKLDGLTLSMSAGQPFGQFLRTKGYLENVRVVPFNGGVKTFMETRKTGQQAYSFSEPFTAEREGAKPKCLMVSDVGFNPYTSVLIVSQETLNANDRTVKRFVAATVKGWQKYLEDPSETHAYINKINPEMSLEVLDFGVKALRPLSRHEELVVGDMDIKRWQQLNDQLVEIGILKSGDVDVNDVMWNSLKAVQ